VFVLMICGGLALLILAPFAWIDPIPMMIDAIVIGVVAFVYNMLLCRLDVEAKWKDCLAAGVMGGLLTAILLYCVLTYLQPEWANNCSFLISG